MYGKGQSNREFICLCVSIKQLKAAVGFDK